MGKKRRVEIENRKGGGVGDTLRSFDISEIGEIIDEVNSNDSYGTEEKIYYKTILHTYIVDSSLSTEEKENLLKKLDYKDIYAELFGEENHFNNEKYKRLMNVNDTTRMCVLIEKKTNKIVDMFYYRPNCRDLDGLETEWIKDLEVVIEGPVDHQSGRELIHFLSNDR